ncbi:DUF4275 family protein [Viridibacillus arvi]|uniref:DUF4275 family protein n=1 Tax=Viridibacillus arvi TaxID=263475 RepID=UPI003D2D8221
MQNKELKMLAIPKWGRYLREKWLENFAGHLTKEEQKEIYMDSFLWHLCSYEKVIRLEKEEAIKAFERQEKNRCTIFYQFTNEAFLVQNAKNLNVKDLPYDDWDHSDIYVMDWENNWTFIITHENGWIGPYFIQKP